MRIWYSVAGEGRGHAYRTIPIVKFLKKRHVVDLFAGDVSFPLLREFNPDFIASLRIIYRKNSVSNYLTFFYNFFRLPFFIISFFRLFIYAVRNYPDVLINDFEPLSNYVAKILRIPCITVDNEAVIISTEYHVPARFRWNARKVRWLVSLISPFANKRIIPTFFYPKLQDKNAVLCSPVMQNEVFSKKARVGKHVLVYQTSKTNDALLPALLGVPEVRFVVYGFECEARMKNVEFKRTGFLYDLRSCSAVITNGGFTLMTEALALGKPVLSLPVLGQFEQVLNGLYLDKIGFGMCSFETSADVIRNFLHKKEKFRRELQRLPKASNRQFFDTLEKVLIEIKNG